jgi:hypothetical protein
MALEISKEDTGSIVAIRTLAPAALEKLVTALKTAQPVSDPREMAAKIAGQVPSIPVTQLSHVLETLYMLYYIRELSGVKPAKFLDDLLDGIRGNPNLTLSTKDLPKLRSVLQKLLSIETLYTISKAARLQRDGERLYCQSKIASDILPVFGSDPSVAPVGAVLNHTLRIGYHEGGDHKEFHIVLDFEDLNELREVVQRALEKDKTLRTLLKTMKLPNLGE